LAAGPGDRRIRANVRSKGTVVENVIAVNFDEESKAYEAMTVLKELDNQGQIALAEAAVVVRSAAGAIDTKETIGSPEFTGTAAGGVFGLIIGVLGGPVGVLLGGAAGILTGSLFDLTDEDDTDSALAAISTSLQVDRTALLAQVDEQTAEVVDVALGRLGGTILRRPMGEVMAEIAASEDAQRAAEKAARKRLHEQKRTQTKEKVDAKIEELKAKLPGHHPAGAAQS
jgi:uncharacterized membrane protein